MSINQGLLEAKLGWDVGVHVSGVDCGTVGNSLFLQGLWWSLNFGGAHGCHLRWLVESTTSTLYTPGLSHCSDVAFFPDLSQIIGTIAACHSRQLCVRHKMVCSLQFAFSREMRLLCDRETLGLKSWSPYHSSDEIQTPCFLKSPREFYCCVRTNTVCCRFFLFKFTVLNYWRVRVWWDKMQEDYMNARIHVWAPVSVLSLAGLWLNCATVFKTWCLNLSDCNLLSLNRENVSLRKEILERAWLTRMLGGRRKVKRGRW